MIYFRVATSEFFELNDMYFELFYHISVWLEKFYKMKITWTWRQVGLNLLLLHLICYNYILIFLVKCLKRMKIYIVFSEIDIISSNVCLLHDSYETIDCIMSYWISTGDILVAVYVYLYRIMWAYISENVVINNYEKYTFIEGGLNSN